jgi:hypothetical protein
MTLFINYLKLHELRIGLPQASAGRMQWESEQVKPLVIILYDIIMYSMSTLLLELLLHAVAVLYSNKRNPSSQVGVYWCASKSPNTLAPTMYILLYTRFH